MATKLNRSLELSRVNINFNNVHTYSMDIFAHYVHFNRYCFTDNQIKWLDEDDILPDDCGAENVDWKNFVDLESGGIRCFILYSLHKFKYHILLASSCFY